MTSEELNKYIYNYFVNDKTNFAILLSGEWGIGKTYYIRNSLQKYFKKRKKNLVVVSAYGINNIFDLSKSIYTECLINKNADYKEARKKKARLGIGKTIVKGLTTFFGINAEIESNDLINIMREVDFSNTLLVIEDLERKSLSTKEFLGYINNLTENDGAKVLLVADESKIDDKDYNDQKEKTIREVVHINDKPYEAVNNIISNYQQNKYFESFLNATDNCVSKFIVDDIMENNEIHNKNLRLFTYACQKTFDLFNNKVFKISNEYALNIFFSIVVCALKSKDNNKIDTFGLQKINRERLYVLPDYVLNFLKNNILDNEEMLKDYKHFVYIKDLEKKKSDLNDAFNVIKNYYVCSQIEVHSSIEKLLESLKTKCIKEAPMYMMIANYLYAIKGDLPKEKEIVDKCLDIIKVNVVSMNINTEKDLFFSSGIEINNSQCKKEFNDFKKEIMDKSIEKDRNIIFGKDAYESLSYLADEIIKNPDRFKNNMKFFCLFDIQKLFNLVIKSSPKEIFDFRSCLHSVYSFSNLNDYYGQDLESLIAFNDKLEKYLSEENDLEDEVIILELRYLKDNLSEFIALIKQV